MNAAMEATIQKVNRVMEGFLTDFDPPEPAAPRRTVAQAEILTLTQYLAEIAGLLMLIEPQEFAAEGCAGESEAYRQNLQRLRGAIRKLQPALEDRLQWITTKLAASHAARSWTDLMRELSR